MDGPGAQAGDPGPVLRRGAAPAAGAAVRAVCVDMWEPFRRACGRTCPTPGIVYDKFHVLRHASEAGG